MILSYTGRSRLSRSSSLAAMLAVAIVACSDSATQPRGAGIRFVAGAGVTDSVQALLPQALVVEVRDQSGRLAPGVTVRFSSFSSATLGYMEAYVSRLDAAVINTLAVDTTDASGRASVIVQLGVRAGPARLLVSVPELGLRDTARFEVIPGLPRRITINVRDTAVSVGGKFNPGAAVVDAWGNTITTAGLTYAPIGGAASVSSDGTVTGASVGRATIVVSAGSVSDTARVSVVPSATIVARIVNSVGNVVAGLALDGSARVTYAGVSAEVVMPQWNPAGDRIAYYEGDPYGNSRVYVVGATGVISRLIAAPDSLKAESFPRYSRDGQWVYFNGVTSNYRYAIWRAHADGTSPERLAGDSSADYGWPDPSPDGRHVAFTAAGLVAVLDLRTGGVTSTGVPGSFPRYSPDGSLILFLGAGTLTVMNADGTGTRIVTSAHPYGLYSSPNWSPDGKWIIIRGPTALELVSVADGSIVPLSYAGLMEQASFKP